MRGPFLLLVLSCVLLGVSTAWFSQRTVNIGLAFLALLGGLCAHVSVNVFNEYFDFRSGLDSRTTRTPFSGGSGTLQKLPELAPIALALAIGTFAITAAIGLYFVSLRGLDLLWVGIPGLVAVAAYTPLLVFNPLACLISPGLGFGTCMVMGTNYALGGGYTITSFIASLVPFFLVSNLLLLNQFPDVGPDKSVGKRHLLTLYGLNAGSWVYALFMVGTYLAIIGGVFAGKLPYWSLLGLLTAPLAASTVRGVFVNRESTEKLIPSLGKNVVVNLATPVFVAIGLFVGV